MLQFNGILFQVGEAAPNVPSNLAILNEFTDVVFSRQSTGIYKMTSTSFTEASKVFLPLETADSRTPLIPVMTRGSEAIDGYIAINYGFEDNEGTVWIRSYNAALEVADDILDNFPLEVKLVQN